MSAMTDGWKRILRLLQKRSQLENAYISLKIENEDLGTVAVDTWVSPVGAVQFNGVKNFSYAGGSLTYIGEGSVLVELTFTQAVYVGGLGVDAVASGTGGVNGVPCEDSAIIASSSFNGVITLPATCRLVMQNGDTLDAYIKQTSEAGGANITIAKGVYHVKVIDVL